MLRSIEDGFIPRDKCMRRFSRVHIPKDTQPYCNATHDGHLCWPPTRAGAIVKQHCPDFKILNPLNYAYRECGIDGKWEIFKNDSISSIEKTYYRECFIKNETTKDALGNFKADLLQVGKINNILGITLLAVSFITIFTAFFIYYFVLPKFVNAILHTKVQKHLFISVALDALSKLVSQVVVLIQIQENVSVNIPFLCEFLATLNQYAELAILAWLAMDTHFLQVTSRSGHICSSGYMTYILIGWGLPVVPTSVWAVTLAVSHKVKCWTGHTALSVVWIVEIPKLLALLASCILLSICVYRIFGSSKNRTMVDVRKIRYEIIMTWTFYLLVVASVLLVMVTTHAPIGLCIPCQYVATIFVSCRGIFLSILYCFLNADVHSFMKYHQTILPTITTKN